MTSFTELHTHAGIYGFNYENRGLSASPQQEEEMCSRSYRFIKRIVDGDATPAKIFQRVLKDKVFPISTSATANAIPFHWKLSLFMFLDHLDQSLTFQDFQDHAAPSWSRIISRLTEPEFKTLKLLSEQIKVLILEGEIPSTKIPSLQRIAAWTLVENIDQSIFPNSIFHLVFAQAVVPEVKRVITRFQNTVNTASTEQLNALAVEVKKTLVSKEGNLVAAHAKWSILLNCPRLSRQAYNDLLFAAAFGCYPQKIREALHSPHFQLLTPENSGEVLYHLVANRDHENAVKLQHFLPLIPDDLFVAILNKAITYEDPQMVALFKPFLGHIYQLESQYDSWMKQQLKKLYPAENPLDGLIRKIIQL